MEESSDQSSSGGALASNPNTRVGIYRTDGQGRCVYVNQSFCELFELSADEAMDLGWLRRIHPSDRARVAKAREKAVSPLPSFYLEYRLQLTGGRTLWVSAFSTALMEGGQFKGRSGMVTPIAAPSEFTDQP
jgi:PAS domain S-box-containing protein